MSQSQKKFKIYTKTGDQGQTSLYDGSRVCKNEQIFDVLGYIDELSAHIGMLMYYLRVKANVSLREYAWLPFLTQTQQKLLNIGSIIATPNPREGQKLPEITIHDVENIENAIDKMDEELKPLTVFIVQSGVNQSEAQAHICRTVTRRVEREILKYGNVDENICKFFNRLSDYFFTLARSVSED